MTDDDLDVEKVGRATRRRRVEVPGDTLFASSARQWAAVLVLSLVLLLLMVAAVLILR